MKNSHFLWISHVIILPLILIWITISEVSFATSIRNFRPDDSAANIKWEKGYFVIPFKQEVILILDGSNFTNGTLIALTTNASACHFDAFPTHSFMAIPLEIDSSSSDTAKMVINMRNDDYFFGGGNTAYFCLDYEKNNQGATHQGDNKWLTLKFYSFGDRILPIPVEILFVIGLMFFSACFSGLNLGLMSLNITELKIVLKCGSKWEKRFAKVIFPIRKHGNYLLCTLLLGNVMVNSTFTILLNDLSGGVLAVVLSTVIIVIFGEIIPQAICNRYGLAIGAITLPLTVLFMILTFPLSFPISKVLDCILGEELGTRYRKEELLELVNQDKENLEPDEKNIIAGALVFKERTAADVMTKINDVFLLDIKCILDFTTMMKIAKSGHSRIPVYENEPTNIIGILFVKDLIFHDADDKIPLNTIVKFYNHSLQMVYSDETLDILLDYFKTGKAHLAIVVKVNNEGEGDPFNETIGVVTLEDIIEEIIQCEIVDESDRYMDNKSYLPIERKQLPDFHIFLDADSTQAISAQQSLAVYLYLSTSVEAFKEPYLTKRILQRFVEQDIYWSISKEQAEANDYYLYERGQPANHFTLVLEGKLQVTVGNDSLKYEAGPFTTFGTRILMNYAEEAIDAGFNIKVTPYVPDYSIKPLTDVTLLYIPLKHYIVALKASCAEKDAEIIFEEEWIRTKEKDPVRPAPAYEFVQRGTTICHNSSPDEEPIQEKDRISKSTRSYKRRASTAKSESSHEGTSDPISPITPLNAKANCEIGGATSSGHNRNQNGNEALIKRMNSCVNSLANSSSSDSDDGSHNKFGDKRKLLK